MLHKVMEVFKFPIGEDDETIFTAQTLKGRSGVGKGLQLPPGIHEFLESAASGVEVVGGKDIFQCPSHGRHVPAVPEVEDRVLKLFEPLALPPLEPKAVGIETAVMFIHERLDGRPQTAGDIENGAEEIEG
jgi:hypothetical protein